MLDYRRHILAIVLAGGQGERLYPLTRDRAKPAVPFGGIYRIVDFTLNNCINSGLRQIYVLTQYKSDSLNRHIRLGWSILSSEMGEFIEIVPPQQRTVNRWYVGTADAIYQNVYTLERERPRFVLLLSGDHVYKMDYRDLSKFHEAREAELTVAVVKIPIAQAPQFGIVEVDAENRMIGFQEKPKKGAKTIPGDPEHCLGSMGVYLFGTEILVRKVLEDAKRDTPHDFGKDIIPGMIETNRVYAYPFLDRDQEAAYWRDVGTLDAYWEANMDLVQVVPLFNLYDQDWPIRTYQEQNPPAKTVLSGTGGDMRHGQALRSLISSGCIISGGTVESSVLSPNVRVNRHAEVFESVLMEGVQIGRRARVRRAIIDKDVVISEVDQIGYDLERDRHRFTVTESGLVIVPKGMKV